MDYSKTVNLLQTPFPMKADLPIREPEMLKKWEAMSLYERMDKLREGKPVFLLHDGPPYANGDIHIGHALNKILKDFVVKYKNLDGYRAPYKPGWDCHGLPIEHQLFKQLGKSKNQVPRIEVRQKATEYALGWVDKQRESFKRLGVFGDWGNPYLTLSKEYVSGIVETFYRLKDKGFIYKGLKPGYWCAYDETALAEAEVEYADKQSDSVFVRFKLKKSEKENTYVLIWTTTPWTLPANRGLAFHPSEKYTYLMKGNDLYIVAEKLKDAVAKKIGAEPTNENPVPGKDFAGLIATNPLTGKESRVVNADYVTMEDGTGIVHIAPGHGVEDFAVGQEWKLETVSPVDERGMFDKSVGRDELVGKHVLKDANKAVMELLGADLLHYQSYKHSYPHCWRCKNPIIFRSTEQWFLRVSPEFRNQLLQQIDSVTWEPAYGVHRIKGMVETRPDWCLSRQRHWGAPIAVFYCKKCGELLWNPAVNKKIIDLIAAEGVDAYYSKPESELVSADGSSVACKCGSTDFRKEMDIVDVWFDSGVSWHSVVNREFAALKPETVMYLEGSDQHRGWFQTSLIPSVALTNEAPYDVVLTHGFIVDGKGHKMSKSLGNVVSPQDIIKNYGADVLRLWVAMSDYREDVRVSQDIIKHMVDVYRRFRNTFRFFLQNTSDFKWSTDGLEYESMQEIDRWVLSQFHELKEKVKQAYDRYEFHVVLSELNRFVSVELSGFYLDALKDRLYCDATTSEERRSVQTALFQLSRGLSVLLAPLLSFTSEEAYLVLRETSDASLPESVFLDSLSSLSFGRAQPALNTQWQTILEIRALVNDELDRQRKAGVLKSSQEAKVMIRSSALKENQKKALESSLDWPFVLQAAEVHFSEGTGAAVEITKTQFPKCERCWRLREDVGSHASHSTLCGRCVTVVESSVSGVN